MAWGSPIPHGWKPCYPPHDGVNPFRCLSLMQSHPCTFLILLIFSIRSNAAWMALLPYANWSKSKPLSSVSFYNEAHLKLIYCINTSVLGKGKDHLVPVFFPEETWKAMHFLCDKNYRSQAGVSVKNAYIFASTRNSDSHVSGWHCVNHILEQLQMKGIVNPTANRHRVSSIMAKFDLSDSEKT